MDVPSFLTTDEACAKLRISRWTLGRWTASGNLAVNKIGRRILVPTSEVERLVAPDTTAITRKLPVPPSWFTPVTSDSVEHGAALLAEVLRAAGVDVDEAGLRPILRGEERPTPIFWNTLINGLARVLAPAEDVVGTAANAVGEHLRDWERRGKPGRLWNKASWESDRDPGKDG